MISRALADTSVFIAHESGRPPDVDALPDEVAVSVVTIGELRAGALRERGGRIRLRRATLRRETDGDGDGEPGRCWAI